MKLKRVNKEIETVKIDEKPMYTDLRQVLDYKKPLSIFYSGVEYESYLEILYNLGVRNFLMSYEYLKGKGLSTFKLYPDIRLFIDSGAFTYMSDPKFEQYTVEQWEEQIVKYLNWAEKHKNQIFAIADLDLQYLVGYDTVKMWREKYFEPFMLRTGVPVCFIYHEEGLDVWDYMCKRYPYVGFSLRIDDASAIDDLFRIAEKHNALIQGMASTNTAMLTQYPFYTVDSTTWNVGLKYGEISVWTGTKMTRAKKTELDSKVFPYIDKYSQKFDHNLIRDEDKTELIRVNAQAFIEAEIFVHQRLKSKMYWLKAKAQTIDLDNLPTDFFPTADWFKGDCNDIEDYARKMNINPEYESVGDLLYDVTTFLNWNNPDYEDMKSWYFEEAQKGLIDELHDNYINRIVPDIETKIQDLISFFKECVSGKNDKLLQLGTNFDRTIRERDSYIEEEETELVDLTEDETKHRLRALLPAIDDDEERAEIETDKLDKEIYEKAAIVPTFDEKGKFVKGQIAVRKPKKVYSKKYPKFACDTCYAASRCPEYKAGYVCAYSKMFDRFDTRNMGDIIQSMQGIVEHNMTRMQRAMVMETLNGTIDPVVTQLMAQNVNYMNMLKQMYESANAEVLKQTRVVRADGTTEETMQVSNPQSGGILEKLFSFNDNKREETPVNDDKVINARYKEVEE